MTRVLVIRLSSLGDVALLIPVLYSVANRYANDRFILLTKKPLQPLFINNPDNLEIYPVHTKEQHKGIKGLRRLFKEVTSQGKREAKGKKINYKIADLHNVIRSRIIDSYFKLNGEKIAVIDKGRREKRALVRKKRKKLVPLKPSIERYQKVFEDLGYDASLDFVSFFPDKKKKEETWIGIAPFAKHRNKIYPLEKMQEIVRLLSLRPQTKLFLFGGKDDMSQLEEWAEKYENVESVAGRLLFKGELLLMNDLDLMVSMDSANMHLASLVNTPVVSIWGATHQYAGFYGYNQNPNNAVQVDMECRPCSIFGDKPCYRGDFACMQSIRPEMIIDRINKNLQ